MALKINGGAKGTGSLSSAIEAIKYATMMGADICNLSWGTPKLVDTLKQVMKESNMLFVAAAGNTGDNNDAKPIYPADLELDNLISVTFVNADGQLTDQSNYGPNSVDLAAPGEDI
jgi:subtilisin family serine protease